MANATVIGFFAIVLWSSTVGLGRLTSELVGPLMTAFIVYGVGGLLLLFGFVRRKAISPRALTVLATTRGATLLTLFVVNQIAFYVALGTATTRLVSVQMALINYLWPTLTILLSLRRSRLPVYLLTLVGAAVSFFGVIVSLSSDAAITVANVAHTLAENTGPSAFAFLAALTWALYSKLARLWPDACPDWAVSFYMLACSITAGLWLLRFPEPSLWSPEVLGLLALNSVCSAFGYLAWTYGMKKGNVILLSATANSIPVLSTLSSSLLLQTQVSSNVWMGSMCVLAGALLCNRADAQS